MTNTKTQINEDANLQALYFVSVGSTDGCEREGYDQVSFDSENAALNGGVCEPELINKLHKAIKKGKTMVKGGGDDSMGWPVYEFLGTSKQEVIEAVLKTCVSDIGIEKPGQIRRLKSVLNKLVFDRYCETVEFNYASGY